MSDAALFIILFAGFFVLRVIAATVFFLLILPDGIRCPHCDSETLRVESRGWNLLLPWFRTSWCFECGWEGLHRKEAPVRSPVRGEAAPGHAVRRSGQ